jgi:PAS domain S-box-containing protein
MKTTINYETLFDILPERYVVFGTDAPHFTMLAANEQYFSVTNKNREQVIGHSLFEVFPDTSEKALKEGKGDLQISLEKVLNTKESDSTGIIRYDLANKDGVMEVRYWQATHHPLFVDGECIGILQSTADVTELVHSNEQLKLANFKIEEALSAGLIGSWSWDIKQDIVTADQGLANIFGVSKEEAIAGLPLEVFLHSIYEDDRPSVTAAIQNTLDSADIFEHEYRTVDAHGKLRWVIARGQVERDESGEPVQFPGIMIDISTRKAAEAKIQESEERLRFMADTMPQLVWVANAEGGVEYFNKHWFSYTGVDEQTAYGEGWNSLLHKSDQARARRVWRHSLETSEPYEIKYRLYHAKSGVHRWVIGRALPFRNDKGDIEKWYGTCTDIDDSIQEIEMRKKLEEALKQERDTLESRVNERTSQLRLTNEGLRQEIKKRQEIEQKIREYSDELKRSNKELEEFAYVSSHDLQEPLRKIQAFSDLLTEEYGGKLGEGEEYLTRIQSSANRMSTLIEDLLVFSRVTTKAAVSKPVNLNKIIEFVSADLQDRIEKENGTITVANALPTVMADETHMRQLFQNLTSNALKFHATDRPPIVEISSRCDEDECTIKISDNGIGIDEKYKEKIFAVFQRLNTKQAYEGTGIGLAVCKKIIERYNGTIQVESQVGVGTTFIITMPIEDEV